MKKIILFILFIPMGFTSINYAGVCIPKGRLFSDEDMIRLAVTDVNSHRQAPLQTNYPGGTEIKMVERIKYASTDDFLQKNPNCCSVGASAPSPDGILKTRLLDRMLGVRGYVTVNYTVEYLDEKNQQQSFNRWSYVRIKNCGDII